MTKIAQLTSRYIESRPFIREMLSEDIISYSKLARQISSELKINNVPAVLVACRRHAQKIRTRKTESPIDIIKKSKKSIAIENHTASITLSINEKHLPGVLEALK